MFSIGSAYKLAVSVFKSKCRGTTSDSTLLRRFWKKLWSLPIPHKVHHFCGRACCDTLPTKVKLMRRNVTVESLCVCCLENAEMNGHIFWVCPTAQEAWSASKLNLLPPNANIDSFQDLLWLELMTNDAGDIKCSKLVMVAWKLWCNRNKIYHQGEAKTGLEVARSTANYLQEFWLAIETHEASAFDLVQPLNDRQENLQNSDWVPPHSGQCKINVDGALFPTKKLAGIGVVIRDQQGRLLAALCRKIRAQMRALEVEAKAYEAGVLLARHLGLRNGVLEGDSLIISNALKQVVQSPTLVAAIVEGIHVLSLDVGIVGYTHV